MCCKGENHSQGKDMDGCDHHENRSHGTCGCGCGGRKILSKSEKIETLEEYRASLKSEIEAVEEELKTLKADQ
jgi:hypothetical protein